ncbi:WD40 repeat-like protein [Rhizopogon vinicolor AM-OR11-026]|uniref:WD40 repeat-like protein n=1 Tax=Rhizopogon vinicolor AM-OR11-026 TaxID=1314800 RepID=A0A1B7N2L4_9AGAM|nr:WD40 repeat-like protein [Rhizopogon vinicolor AM-OR11-026]
MILRGHTEGITNMSYFQDGKRFVSASSWDRTIRRWDMQSGEEIKEEQEVGMDDDGGQAAVVSRDGRWIITSSEDDNNDDDDNDGGCDNLKAYEVETGIVRRFEDYGSESRIDISPDNMLVAGARSESEIVQIWSLNTGKLVAGPFRGPDEVGVVRFSQDSKKLAMKSSMGRYLEVWDILTHKLDARVGKSGYCEYQNGPNFFTFTPVFWTDKETIVTAFGFIDDDYLKMIYEFTPSTLETVGAPFEGHTKCIVGLALSFDGALLASSSEDHTIKLWAFESRQLLASFHVMGLSILTFSPDSRQLAYASLENIYICNTPPDILASIEPATKGQPTLPKTDATIERFLDLSHPSLLPLLLIDIHYRRLTQHQS